MDLPSELRWSLFFYDLLWTVPLVASVATVVIVLVLRRRLPTLVVLLSSFTLAVTLLGVGIGATWLGGYRLMEAALMACGISVDLIYEGWVRTFWPLASTVPASVAVLLVSAWDMRAFLQKVSS